MRLNLLTIKNTKNIMITTKLQALKPGLPQKLGDLLVKISLDVDNAVVFVHARHRIELRVRTDRLFQILSQLLQI